MKTIVDIKNLCYEISSASIGITKDGAKTILKDISFPIIENEILGIAGESGCGKTTLAKIIAGIYEPSGGEVISKLDRSGKGRGKIQILFQNSRELLNPLRTVESVLKGINDEALDKIIDLVKIYRRIFPQYNGTLSGGERQRVALARLLLAGPELLILDEPFSSQDPESVKNLSGLFKKINDELHTTILCISHNLQVFRHFADRMIIMRSGQIIESGETGKVFNSPEHKYTEFLMKAEKFSIKREDFNF